MDENKEAKVIVQFCLWVDAARHAANNRNNDYAMHTADVTTEITGVL